MGPLRGLAWKGATVKPSSRIPQAQAAVPLPATSPIAFSNTSARNTVGIKKARSASNRTTIEPPELSHGEPQAEGVPSEPLARPERLPALGEVPRRGEHHPQDAG